MLFSNEEVAQFVNGNFEPAWEMVRPVPVIRIDFGNGQVATRTLHGNIASHVCAVDGQILDILPGIYTPPVYMAALQQLRLLAASLGPAELKRQTRLRDYHREKAQALRDSRARIAYPRASTIAQGGRNELDRGKAVVERRVEEILVQRPEIHGAPRRPAGQNLANWEMLAVDTWDNESQRRLRIHEKLAAAYPARPEQIKRWLYKEVLHADLDDPYLGLGDAIIGDDIFREES